MGIMLSSFGDDGVKGLASMKKFGGSVLVLSKDGISVYDTIDRLIEGDIAVEMTTEQIVSEIIKSV